MDPCHCFDLERELARWRQSLAAHESLTPERAAELETHLRDEIAALQTRGLDLRESFLVASLRLGDTDALADQFTAANPAAVWRHRVFWMLMGVLTVQTVFLLQALLRFFMYETIQDPHGLLHPLTDGWGRELLITSFVFAPLLLILVIMVAFVRLARGRWIGLGRALEKLCFRRGNFAWRLFFWATLPSLSLLAMQVLVIISTSPRAGVTPTFTAIPVLLMTALSLSLAVLAARFAPPQLTASRH